MLLLPMPGACSPELDALADKLYTGKPEDIQDWWGHPLYWACLEFGRQAVERLEASDQQAVRDVLATQQLHYGSGTDLVHDVR